MEAGVGVSLLELPHTIACWCVQLAFIATRGGGWAGLTGFALLGVRHSSHSDAVYTVWCAVAGFSSRSRT